MLLQPPAAGHQLVALALHEETVVLHGRTPGKVDLLMGLILTEIMGIFLS